MVRESEGWVDSGEPKDVVICGGEAMMQGERVVRSMDIEIWPWGVVLSPEKVDGVALIPRERRRLRA